MASCLGKLTDFPRKSSASRKLWNRAESGGPLAASYCFFAGAPGSTAATPSGLILKAKNISGSLPGFPHW
jgi:hypothetical protein